MALFERDNAEFRADVGAQALSGTVARDDFVEKVYEKLSSVYDLTFGPLLHPGRLFARDRLGIKAGGPRPGSGSGHWYQPGPLPAALSSHWH